MRRPGTKGEPNGTFGLSARILICRFPKRGFHFQGFALETRSGSDDASPLTDTRWSKGRSPRHLPAGSDLVAATIDR